MYRTPVILSSILFLIVICIFIFIIKSKHFQLTNNEILKNSISLFTCLGGLISVIFVIYSYIQTNQAFVESFRPSLLIQVVSDQLKKNQQDNTTLPFTFIHYENTSSNEFTDLSIQLLVRVANREIDISDLFNEKMFMASKDQRNRRFETLSFLAARGIDINKETISGNQVMFITGYTYTFNNNIERRKGPEYKWNAGIKCWEIY